MSVSMEPPRSQPPFLSTQQMREVDRAMIEDYGISLLQMMENAGRCLADLARSRFFDGDPRGQRVLVLAGTGGNGGGGLVCARRLHNWGADVRVLMTADSQRLGDVADRAFSMVRRVVGHILFQCLRCPVSQRRQHRFDRSKMVISTGVAVAEGLAHGFSLLILNRVVRHDKEPRRVDRIIERLGSTLVGLSLIHISEPTRPY